MLVLRFCKKNEKKKKINFCKKKKKNYSILIYLTAMGMSVQNTTQLFNTDYAIDNNRLVTSSTYEFKIAVLIYSLLFCKSCLNYQIL